MLDTLFIEWLRAKIDSLKFFIDQVEGTPYFDKDDAIELADLKGELRGYQTVLDYYEN